MVMLVVAAACFVGTHLLLAHAARAPLVRSLGEGGFMGVYSLVAAATLAWTIWAFVSVPPGQPAWILGSVGWALATLLMLLASVLLLGSLVGNPAFPNPGAATAAPGQARGVYAITRHPMMWSVAIWALVHAAVYPVAKSFVLAAAMLVLALVGAAFQDRKKAMLQPDTWPAWQSRTSFVPFAATLGGRAHVGGFGTLALAGGLVFWLAVTWAHRPLTGWAAGIWRWL